MTGKEFLKQIRDINITIISLQMEIEKMDTILTNTAVKYKEINVQTSLPSDPMADKVIELSDYKDDLKECLLKQTKIKRQALVLINTLEKRDDRNILMLRYINCMTFKEIMDKTDLSQSGVNKKLREAEDAFDTVYRDKSY